MATKTFNFNISLSILNHLGRNLYRNFSTVLGEAISNAWDADAKNVWIFLDREKDFLCIKDDGEGMNSSDFQDKFLKIGYSKRREGMHVSSGGRPFIGRKGIGKLALLSCAQKISIYSKANDAQPVSGMIDNAGLDDAILDDLDAHDYPLADSDSALFEPYLEGFEHGTILCFEGINEGIKNSEEFLRKIIALHFRFSLVDPNFSIFLNGEEISISSLKELAENTQFVWNINNFEDPFLTTLCNPKEVILVPMERGIKGFIASVNKPRNRNIHSTGEKVGIELFVNGRLRENDILKHFQSARVPESYLYGQVHLDALDGDEIDRFTSSREGLLSDDPMYSEFLSQMKVVISRIIEDWDALRDKYSEDGDPDNINRETSETKKAKSLYREVAKEYTGQPGGGGTDEFIKDLADDAAFNSSSYVQCFISENLLRRHITDSGLRPEACTNTDPAGGTCEARNPGEIARWCPYCKGENRKQALQDEKRTAGTAIRIRSAEEDLSMYLDYIDLAKIIDDTILRNEDKPYKPLRNSVMHTSLLTDEAKTKLSSVFDNIVATVKSLVTTV